MPRLIMLGKAAIELRCAEHHLRKLCGQNLIPFQRAGKYRVFSADDLPKIRLALIEAGYLRAEPEAAGAH